MIRDSDDNMEAVQSTERSSPHRESVPELDLQPGGQVVKDSYSLQELLGYHDRAFVEFAFQALLRRKAASVELDSILAELRSGQRSKVEIIETLVENNKAAATRITGLPSPAVKGIYQVPIIGYLLRVVRGISRLPTLMKDQQRFEAYSLGQQQQLFDYMNQYLVPAINRRPILQNGNLTDSSSLSDAIESVIMLSDSLISLSEKQQLSEDRLSELTNVCVSLQGRIQELQAQHEKSESQLHASLVNLTQSVQVLQQQLVKAQQEINQSVTSQREFLVQEQELVVLAQKLTLRDVETRLAELNKTQKDEIERLKVVVDELKTRLDINGLVESEANAEELEQA